MSGTGTGTGPGPAPTIPLARTPKSPGRSFSLSLKSKGKLPVRPGTGVHDRRWDVPDRSTTTGLDPETNSLRRTMSSEDSRSIQTRSTISPPPLPPPKDPIPRRPPDQEKVIREVRMKMSSRDQEAMRKLRLTMPMNVDMSVSDSGSSRVGSSSTLGHGNGQSGRPGLGSRRSTLSRQITSEDLDDPMYVPISTSVSHVMSHF
jgi:hypothetical protein